MEKVVVKLVKIFFGFYMVGVEKEKMWLLVFPPHVLYQITDKDITFHCFNRDLIIQKTYS